MNVVDLGNRESLETYRAGVVEALPQILGDVGFAEQARLVEQGRVNDFLTWYTGSVAIEGHGATANAIGLTPEQTSKFNAHAIEHRLMGPVDLWTPDDDIPTGQNVGDIKLYDPFPEIDKLIPEAYQAGRSFVVGALFRGMVGRIDSAVELARRNERFNSGIGYEFVMLSGQREPLAGDLGGEVYKEFFPQTTGDVEQYLELLKDEPTMATAIFAKHLEFVGEPEVVYDENPDSPEMSHPDLGPRTWIKKSYTATLDGKPVTLTVMNAKAVPPAGQMNRSGWKPNASDALSDWIEHTDPETLNQVAVYNISYAHMLRIAAALHKAGHDVDSRLASAIPVGNMPLESTWYGVNRNGHMNGGTLGFKEIVPVVMNVNELVGRDKNDLSV